ncbi:MAG: hypothetical protein ABH808_00655 [Candidatus Kuenenbacteria bacterium]
MSRPDLDILNYRILFFKKRKKVEINLIKKEKTEQERQLGEIYFLTNEEKEKAGIDPSLEIKAKKVKGDLGTITVIEFPKTKISNQIQENKK